MQLSEYINKLNYRGILSAEYSRRSGRNTGYSLRAFARDIDLPASKISNLLKGHGGLSLASAKKVAKKLHFSDMESAVFITMVEAQHSRSESGRQRALNYLEVLKAKQSFQSIELDKFRFISDWIHFCILELSTVKDFQSNLDWVSERLNVSKADISFAIDRLIRNGLLVRDKNGNLIQTQHDLVTPTDIPSVEIRRHHENILKKAISSLEQVSVSKRDFSTMTMAIDSNKIVEAKKALVEFQRKFCKNMQEGDVKDRVYCLAMQFFPLDNFPDDKEKE